MDNYKSEGERAIAKILEDEKIKFIYEYPMLINEQKKEDTLKLRIWYPDFWLPQHSIIIEYFGMRGKESYDEGMNAKKEAYKKLYIDLIPVYYETTQKDLKAYLLMSISRLINENRKCFDNRKEKNKELTQ